MDILKRIVSLLGLKEKKVRYRADPQRKSKHMGKNFRHTKAYADDRQKAPQNRRKHGMRKRK